MLKGLQTRRKRERPWPQDVLSDISDGIIKEVNCAEIHRRLKEKYVGREEDIPDVRTIQRDAKKFWEKNPAPDPLDEPFQWHKLAEYGIPWEASGYLLSLWYGIWKGEFLDMVGEANRITAREVLWWWRVHLAAPDISPPHTLMWAGRFTGVEKNHLVYGMELDFEAYYQCLAFRDFEGEENAKVYWQAVEEGRVKQAIMPTLRLAPEDYWQAVEEGRVKQAAEKTEGKHERVNPPEV